MKRYSLFYNGLAAALFALTLTLQTHTTHAQSTVTIPTTGVTLYVDSSFTGTTVNQPGGTYKSIQSAVIYALSQNRSNNNVRILIKKGNGYRESINLDDSYKTAKTITLEAFDPNNRPTILGSDYWGGNTFGLSAPLNGNQVYYHSCNTPQGIQLDIWANANANDITVSNFNIPPVVRRNEVMIVRYGTQSVPMKRVLSYGEMVPGSFYVHEDVGVNGYGNFFFMLPPGAPSGANIGQVYAEVGVRSTILVANGRQNLILKNLNFQTAADYFYGAVRIQGCTNVLIDGCAMNYNAGKGLVIDNNTNTTIQYSNFNSNGITGLAAGYAKNLLVQNCVSNGNNWRGAQGGLGEFDSAGVKIYKAHNSKFNLLTTNDNQGECPGLWLDTDIKNVTVSGLTSQRNKQGLFYEAAQGPCIVNTATNGTKSNMSNNRIAGVLQASANNLTLDGCIIGNNSTNLSSNIAGAQVLIFSIAAGRTYVDFENTGIGIQYAYGDNTTIKNSKIYWNLDTNFHPMYANGDGNSFGYQLFMKTLKASNNQYWHKDQYSWAFQRYDNSFTQGIFTNWRADLAVPANNTTGTVRETGSSFSIIP
jgi:hypothetical protein